MNYINKYMETFFLTLEYELAEEYCKEYIDDISRQEYICNRIKEIAKELVEVTDSNYTLSECLKNLETHTHDVVKQYGECDRMFYDCSKPIY